MKKIALIQSFIKLLIVIFLLYAMVSSAAAQSQKRYEEHEVIDIGNGMKIEVLKYRGEGENEECNVIYYTDRRQTGKRVWEKSGKIREMERAAKLGRDQAMYGTKKKIEIQSTESISTGGAEEINSVDQKKQPEAETPKALMKPKKPDPVKAPKSKTYSSKNMNLITTATQMLAANSVSNYSNNSSRKSTDTSNLKKTKTNLPIKTMVAAPLKKDTIQASVASKKTSATTTSLAPEIAKVTNAKIITPAKEKPKAVFTKDSAQRVAAKSTVVRKTSLPVDSAKTIKANVIQPAIVKPKADLTKDSAQRVAATKSALVKKTSLYTDSAKTIKANVIKPDKEKAKAVLTNDSAQSLAATKNSLVRKTSLPTDSVKTHKANVTQPAKEKPKVVITNDSAQSVAATKNTLVRKSSLPADSLKIIKVKLKEPVEQKPVVVFKKDSVQNIAATKNSANKISFPTDTISIAKVTIGGTSNQIPKAIYPVKSKSAVTTFDENASAIKSLGSPTIGLVSPASNNKPPSKNNVDVKDTLATKTISKKAPVTTSPLNDHLKSPALTANKTTVVKRSSSLFKPSSVSNKKFVFDSATAVRIAVFAPLYIDDAFTGADYNLGKANLPKNILTGLEFYNGVMMAIDSLSQEGVNAEVLIYDTRQTNKPLNNVLASAELNNIGLVIAYIANTSELKQFSEFSLKKNIPLISATYPNTTGIINNPFFVLLNSSFPVHLEGLYKYMQRLYPIDNIIAVKRPGAAEDVIKNYITELNKTNRPALNIKWIDLKETFTMADLAKNLDSTKNNVVFVASTLESFGLKLVKTLSINPAYRTTAIGMPTWDGIKELNGKDCSNVEIVYSTPFVYTSQNTILNTGLINKYRDRYYSRPSDIAFKGFESAYHFIKLLSKYQANLVNNLSDKSFTLFNQFDIQPVKVRKTSIRPDYLENKKLYFIRKQEGNIKSIM